MSLSVYDCAVVEGMYTSGFNEPLCLCLCCSRGYVHMKARKFEIKPLGLLLLL